MVTGWCDGYAERDQQLFGAIGVFWQNGRAGLWVCLA